MVTEQQPVLLLSVKNRISVNVIVFAIAFPLRNSFSAVNKTPTHWNRSIFSARLKQSDVLALAANVVSGNEVAGNSINQSIIQSVNQSINLYSAEAQRF